MFHEEKKEKERTEKEKEKEEIEKKEEEGPRIGEELRGTVGFSPKDDELYFPAESNRAKRRSHVEL